LHDQIFVEKGDIDIAFMGPSTMFWGIDTPRVEAELSKQLGRPAVVRSLCWNAPGFDPFYFIMEDLLRRRKVRVIVLCDCATGARSTAHSGAPSWFRWADNAGEIDDLGLRAKISFYSSAILGIPRNLLGMLRPNLPVIPGDEISWPGFSHLKSPALRLGSLAVNLSRGGTFSHYAPRTDARPSDVCVYSDATRQNFKFSGTPMTRMQAQFLGKIGALAHNRQVKLVYLHMPLSTEKKSPVIEEDFFWPDFLGGEVTMMGIPSAKLFAGLGEEEIGRFFWNYQHLNQNGQEYFTSVIAPSIAGIYEAETKP
jgi:hypothetical protein